MRRSSSSEGSATYRPSNTLQFGKASSRQHDLSPVAELTKLRELYVAGTQETNVTPQYLNGWAVHHLKNGQ